MQETINTQFSNLGAMLLQNFQQDQMSLFGVFAPPAIATPLIQPSPLVQP